MSAPEPKPVTPFGGLVSLISFFERIGLARRVSETMPFAYTSNNAIPPAQTHVAFLVSVVAGARRLAHTDWLRADKALHAWLRSGNTGTARGSLAFFTEALVLMPAAWKLRCVRADSGFFDNALLSFLETRAIPYIVVARLTTTLKRKAAGLAL